jgi:membrane-bound serine protease (ClpP class)
MYQLRVFIILLLIIFGAAEISAQTLDTNRKLKVYNFEIKEDIGPNATRKTVKAFEEANAFGADLIILSLNTYGGLVGDADSIRTNILNSKIPVYAFIENNAASAGALISIACHKIFMRKGANIGAATVVDQSGAAAPDKYQSYMRSKMRATAETRGRNPDIAEGMVDGNMVVEGVNKAGQVITLTTSEAIKNGYCEGQRETLQEVLAQEGISDYDLKTQAVTRMDRLIGFLINPAVSGVLIVLILGGIYYELRTPGIGFPLLVSVVSALLYFAPLYLEGLAANWEILLFIVGLILLGLEVFVIPGFGVAGIAGISLIFASFVLTTINNVDFDFSNTETADLNVALTKVVAALFGFIILMLLFGGTFVNSPLFKKFALQTTLEGKATALDTKKDSDQNLIGTIGICITDLKPHGKIEILGKQYEGMARNGFIEANSTVKIVEIRGGDYLVIKA